MISLLATQVVLSVSGDPTANKGQNLLRFRLHLPLLRIWRELDDFPPFFRGEGEGRRYDAHLSFVSRGYFIVVFFLFFICVSLLLERIHIRSIIYSKTACSSF